MADGGMVWGIWFLVSHSLWGLGLLRGVLGPLAVVHLHWLARKFPLRFYLENYLSCNRERLLYTRYGTLRIPMLYFVLCIVCSLTGGVVRPGLVL